MITRRSFTSWSRAAVLTMIALALGPAGRTRRSQAQVKDGIVVVVNARNPTARLAKGEVAKLFLGRLGFWHGVVPVRLYIRPDTGAAAAAFYPKLLGMSPQGFRSHWDKQQLSGKAVAPEVIGPVDELVKKVAATPGGIGFALASETWDVELKGVKLIEVQ
ncbi:MAG: hypothetical protein KBG48_11495 [Kofleriaceae bacterium]|jgi:ABC-type phosphate transport system substrate-binding protein|nr:hypothetical protein [Kofleriaceae bacterium]MBP9168009.1 hypothetical protein [Kofleriaceae bacterium]MBP9856843.1 hypothetical protein [Kofleriaceae bacterium]